MADRSPRTYGADNRNWWLIGNVHGGLSVAYGKTAAEARGEVRDAIAGAFLEEGLSLSAARQGARSYRVSVTAGGLTYDEARAARDEWDGGAELATALRRRWLTETGQRLDRWMVEADRRKEVGAA